MRQLTPLLRYAVFALIAGGVNLGCQHLTTLIYQGMFALTGAMMVGTGAGLVTKYILDKRWIFEDRSTGVKAHARRFSLYTLSGGFTTLIFWGMEYGFDAIPPAGRFRYLGAVLGLLIGYVVKYQIDRRYVFAMSRAASATP
ncbi:GtrA family protein [Azospirillum sp. B4]|uniref:GtrA family protein n=1 Tax=Azospirillum sp. B4 TaxID=95605 RepID=UPI0005C89763|nr:GtrA family protein [Azospirillum sp. B4]